MLTLSVNVWQPRCISWSWQAFAAEPIVVVHFRAAIKVVRLGCMKKAFLGSSKHSSYCQVAQAVFMLGGGVPKNAKQNIHCLFGAHPNLQPWLGNTVYELYLSDTGFWRGRWHRFSCRCWHIFCHIRRDLKPHCPLRNTQQYHDRERDTHTQLNAHFTPHNLNLNTHWTQRTHTHI